MKKEEIIEMFKNIKAEMSENALDFIDQYDIDPIWNNYFSDLYIEYATNNTYIYYKDQRDYYDNHVEECEEALLNYYDGDTIYKLIKENGLEGLICLSAETAQSESIRADLDDQDCAIIKALTLKYMIENFDRVNEKMTLDQFVNILNNLIIFEPDIDGVLNILKSDLIIKEED